METIDYQKQALDFLQSTGTEFKAEFLKNDIHFTGDKDTRDIYKITIKRGTRKFSFDFGQSINNSGFKIVNKNNKVLRSFVLPATDTFKKSGKWDMTKIRYWANQHVFVLGYSESIQTPIEPSPYDVLACLTKYDVGTFEDFCSEFGYDTDSKTAEKTYKAVCKEYDNVCKIWTDEEIEQLQEIN